MIKIAQECDLPRICDLVEMGINELPVKYYDVDRSVLEDTIYKSWIVAPCLKVVIDGKVVGCASMDLGALPWSKKPYITTNMVYVLPKFRSSRIIKELYKEITKFAELQGVLYLDNFVSGADKIDGRARLARINGLELVGVSIMHNGEKK